MKKFIILGKKIYNISKIKEFKRFLVFIIRVFLNLSMTENIYSFFINTKTRNDILNKEPFLIELVTREFLYAKSTFKERVNIVLNNFKIIEKKLSVIGIEKIYLYDGIRIWEEKYENMLLHLNFIFEGGQKKEGVASVMLNLNNMKIYQMIFWLGYDENNQEALYIGAMQGSNEAEANNLIKGLTKHFYGYRTKNLILYMTRCLAKSLDINKIYAVSNKGYYANNHLRIDRKLKTSLDEFWEETGGKLTTDYRFYELPVEEYRKSLDEIKTHKRSQYRNRFKKLDEVEEKIIETVRSFRL